MPYEVILHREASKELLELPGPVYRRIQAGLIDLQTEPRPRGQPNLEDMTISGGLDLAGTESSSMSMIPSMSSQSSGSP